MDNIEAQTCPPIRPVEDNLADVDLTLRAPKRRNPASRVEVARDGEQAVPFSCLDEHRRFAPAVFAAKGEVRQTASSCIVQPLDFDPFVEVAHRVEPYWCVLNRYPDTTQP